MSNYSIDLNCDLGESFGAYQLGNDEGIMPYITSANIACGFHAGDPTVMKKTVRLAIKHGVAIGAHPGFPDLQGFGRRNMALSDEEVYDTVIYQIGALKAIVEAEGADLHHVKPHGALYNMAAGNTSLANAIAEATVAVSPKLKLYGLAGSELIAAAQRNGLLFAREAFSDRTYQADGTLTPRHLPGALINDPDQALAQVMKMMAEERVDTICIHGDGSHAIEFAAAIYHKLKLEQISVESPK